MYNEERLKSEILLKSLDDALGDFGGREIGCSIGEVISGRELLSESENKFNFFVGFSGNSFFETLEKRDPFWDLRDKWEFDISSEEVSSRVFLAVSVISWRTIESFCWVFESFGVLKLKRVESVGEGGVEDIWEFLSVDWGASKSWRCFMYWFSKSEEESRDIIDESWDFCEWRERSSGSELWSSCLELVSCCWISFLFGFEEAPKDLFELSVWEEGKEDCGMGGTFRILEAVFEDFEGISKEFCEECRELRWLERIWESLGDTWVESCSGIFWSFRSWWFSFLLNLFDEGLEESCSDEWLWCEFDWNKLGVLFEVFCWESGRGLKSWESSSWISFDLEENVELDWFFGYFV